MKTTQKGLEYIEFDIQTNSADQEKIYTFSCIAFGNACKFIKKYFQALKTRFAVYQGSLIPNKKDTHSVLIQVKEVELIGSSEDKISKEELQQEQKQGF